MDLLIPFFKKFKIGGELNFDIKDLEVSKYLGIGIINIRKRLANAYSKTKKFIENSFLIKKEFIIKRKV